MPIASRNLALLRICSPFLSVYHLRNERKCAFSLAGSQPRAMRPTTDLSSSPSSSLQFVPVDADKGHCRCDLFIWSGSLFRLSAVAKIGLPSSDYLMDLSELEYGYRARQLRYASYVVSSSVLHQDVGRPPGVVTRTWRFGPLSFRLYEKPPARCYYYVRNTLYFWLYQVRPPRPRRIVGAIFHAVVFPRTFAVRPFSHSRHLVACLRGLRDGLTGNMAARY